MKRKKNVEIETEDLREKLGIFQLKVQERKARESSIELKTVALLDKNVSLDEELTMEIKDFASMRERMAIQRKNNKVFHSNMIDKLQRMREKYPIYEQEADSGPDNTHLVETGEDDDEEIVY